MQIPEPLIQDIQKSVANLYKAKRDEPDFDATPVFFAGKMINGEAKIANVAMLVEAHPKELLPAIIKITEPDFGILVFPGWEKDPAGNRVGEMVMMVAETEDTTVAYKAKVTRTADDCARLEEFIRTIDGMSRGALTHFINRTPERFIAPGTDTRH